MPKVNNQLISKNNKNEIKRKQLSPIKNQKLTRFHLVMFHEREHKGQNVDAFYKKLKTSHRDEKIEKINIFFRHQPTKDQFNCKFNTIHIDAHGSCKKIYIPMKHINADINYTAFKFAKWTFNLIKLRKNDFVQQPLTVNFLSCYTAGKASKRRMVSPENSFAYSFCYHMNMDHKVNTEVIARFGAVHTKKTGRKEVATDERHYIHKADSSKFKFSMENSKNVKIEVEEKVGYKFILENDSGFSERFEIESREFVPYTPKM